MTIEIYTSLQDEPVLKTPWMLFNSEIAAYLPEFLSYAVPSCAMIILIWWPTELITMYAGWIGIGEIAANVILMNIAAITTDTTYGIGMVATCLVGKSLGENHPVKAKTYAKAVIF